VLADLRDGFFYVTTVHGSDGGVPCIAAGPVAVLENQCSAAELGRALKRGLDQSTRTYPYPENSEAWKKVTEPLLRAAKAKSWNAYARRASNLTVDREQENYRILPTVRERANAFMPVMAQQRVMLSPSDEELGRLVMDELRLALERDGVS
jgi:hypothetical protein